MNKCKTLLLLVCLFSAVAVYSQQTRDTTINNDSIFRNTEVEASYPGGVMSWRKFLEKNMNANTPVDNGATSGKYTIITEFIVNADGTISNLKALTNLGYGMEEEVLWMIKKSGPWIPATINQKPVKAYKKQPFTFVVQEDGFDIRTAELFTLFTGMDNELEVEIDKIKFEDIRLIISEGSVVKAPNEKFIARVDKPGRVTIEAYNTKKNKLIGTISFEVKDKNDNNKQK